MRPQKIFPFFRQKVFIPKKLFSPNDESEWWSILHETRHILRGFAHVRQKIQDQEDEKARAQYAWWRSRADTIYDIPQGAPFIDKWKESNRSMILKKVSSIWIVL